MKTLPITSAAKEAFATALDAASAAMSATRPAAGCGGATFPSADPAATAEITAANAAATEGRSIPSAEEAVAYMAWKKEQRKKKDEMVAPSCLRKEEKGEDSSLKKCIKSQGSNKKGDILAICILLFAEKLLSD